MTDNDIIKALECCVASTSECDKCPLYIVGDGDCFDKAKQSALDIINRQRAEIDARINEKKTLLKYMAEQKAEIEHLRTCNETQKETIRTYHIGGTKLEIAREIFEDIERTIVNKYYTELYHFVNSKGGRCWGKTVKLTAFNIYNRLRESLAELKNKYTKTEKGGE